MVFPPSLPPFPGEKLSPVFLSEIRPLMGETNFTIGSNQIKKWFCLLFSSIWAPPFFAPVTYLIIMVLGDVHVHVTLPGSLNGCSCSLAKMVCKNVGIDDDKLRRRGGVTT